VTGSGSREAGINFMASKKCSFTPLQNNITKVTGKMWVGSKPGPQNKNIISSSKVFNPSNPSSD
jgi:hypothetical protein